MKFQVLSGMEAKRILLVDDDDTITTSFQIVLQREGYQVDTASTGRQALEKIGEAKYHLAILDVKLPDILGTEVAGKIRSQDKEIRLVITTGYPDLADSIEAIDIGIEEILLKPINVDELLHVIRESL